MPAWGLAGGGPLNEHQVNDVVNYLKTIQIPQQEAVDKTPGAITAQTARLENADAVVAATILNQRQVLAEIEQAPADSGFILPLSQEARDILDSAGEGVDTDGRWAVRHGRKQNSQPYPQRPSTTSRWSTK